jgi:hypothetical protein
MHRYVLAPVAALALALAGMLAACGSDGPTGPSTADPSIVTTALPVGFVGEPYAEGVNATGGDGSYSWDIVEGILPPGLVLSVEDLTDDDLVITGTPELEGSFSFRLRLRIDDGRADSVSLTIEIREPQPLQVATLQLVPALAGYEYGVQLRSTASGDERWTLVSGSLPSGLSLSDDGVVSGVPTSADTAQVTVRVNADGETAVRDLTLVVNLEDQSRFNITAFPIVSIPAPLRDNVEEALRRWEEAIVGDLTRWDPPEGSFNESSCGGFGGLADGTSVDDMIMMINIDSIDGPGAVLGRAGPCYVRAAGEGETIDGDDLPIFGILTLDEEDLLLIPSEETITDIIQHEMGHILGLGPLWDRFDLLEAEGTANPRYTGAQAIAAYQDAGGADATIPVENQGGSGTADSHWREIDFDDELMTGFSEAAGTNMFLSEMSIAAYADMGYVVDRTAAEDEPLLASLAADATASDLHLGSEIVGVGAIIGITRDGTPVYTLEPPTRTP